MTNVLLLQLLFLLSLFSFSLSEQFAVIFLLHLELFAFPHSLFSNLLLKLFVIILSSLFCFLLLLLLLERVLHAPELINLNICISFSKIAQSVITLVIWWPFDVSFR